MQQSEGAYQTSKILSDRYQILSFLGGGEETEVYKVKDIIGGQTLVMKVLREDATKDAELRMNREFYHLSRFSHSGIVAAYDYGTTPEKRPYFTQEHFEGVPINVYFPKGYASGLDDVTIQTLQALDSIHAQGLIHCDLKPQHVLIKEVDGKPVVKLLDFGFAERLSLNDAVEPRGTLGYVAPEVFKGADADARADLYSLGLVLYETVTGRGPGSEKNLREWIRKQYYSNFERPSNFDATVPGKFESVIMSMIAREPERRPHSAGDVINTLTGGDAEPEVTGPRKYLMAPGFVGRDEALQQLRDVLAGASKGDSKVVCISGERGVGKSRLMSEFKFMTQLEGSTILSFEPASLGARSQSLIESLLKYLRIYSPDEGVPEPEPGRSGLTEEGKYRLFETLAQRLKGLAASHRVEHSLVLIVDDFELFDPTSLEFLRYLAFSLEKDRMVVLACGLKEKRFLDLIKEFDRTGRSLHVPLPPMTPEEVHRLAESLLGEVKEIDRLTDWLVKTTGGNPLFVIETIYALIEGKVLAFRGGRWGVVQEKLDAYKPPDTLTDVSQRRLHGLSKEELEVLQIGSATGAPFSLEFLRSVLSFDEKVLFNAIGRLKSLGLLRSFSADGAASFVLASKILEATVTEQISVEQRRENHRRVALALELLYPDKLEELVFDLAHHYTQAGIADRAYACSMKAGEKAQGMQLSEQALGFFETALQLSTKAATPRERVELIKQVGVFRQMTGKIAEATDAFTQGMGIIVADSELSKHKELLAVFLRNLGLIYQRQGKNEDALNYLNQALLMQPEKSGQDYIRTLNDIGWSYCSSEEFEKAEELMTQALQLTEKLKSKDPDLYNELSSQTLYYFSVLAWSRYDFVLALQLAERSLGIYESMRDDLNMGKVSQLIATLWWRRGELDKAKEYYERYLPSQRKSGNVYFLLRTLQGLGIICQDEGEWDKAFDYSDEAMRLAERIGDQLAIVYLCSNLGSITAEKGEWEDSERYYRRAIDIQAKTNLVSENDMAAIRGNLAELLGRTGRLDEGERILGECIKQTEDVPDNILRFGFRTGQTELALLAERNDQARGYLVDAFGFARREQDWRRRAEVFTLAARLRLAGGEHQKAVADSCKALLTLKDYPSSKEYAVALRYSGLAKCFIDKHERGTQEIRRSVELLRNLGTRYELGLSLLASAQALTQADRAEPVIDVKMPVTFRPVPEKDLAEALGNLREADEIFRMLGARIDSARTEELMEILTQVSATMQLKARERGEYLKVFYRLSELMSMDLEKDDFADRVLDLIVEVTKAERGILFLMQNNKLVPAAARGIDHATVEDAREVSMSVLRKVKRRGELVFSADALSDPRFSAANSVMLHQIRSLLCAPLRVDNRVVGTIYLDSRATAHLFLEEDKNLLSSVANLLAATIEKSAAFKQLQDEMATMREDILVDAATGAFLGRSKAIREVYRVIDRIADSDATVLLTGRTGTGKGVLARLVHSKSSRKDKKFLAINCGAMPENLFESELFGHCRGSFTGAHRDKEGLFETAEGGTIFLDEITNTSLGVQAKLLQVLEERIIRRVGETQTRNVNVRLICATNKLLDEEVKAGRFREDLFYRMNVVAIDVPPLKERLADIPPLANFFVKRYAKQLNKPVTGFDDRVLAVFQGYAWPGNVRELQNVVERAVIMAQGRRVTLDDLGEKFVDVDAAAEGATGRRRRAFDRDQVIEALRATDGNVTKAAEMLATHRRQLQRLMKRYNIDRSAVD